jgi:hypothetical protein
MSRDEAHKLAERVRVGTQHAVSVEPEDSYFVVVVTKLSGDTWIGRDEQDSDWMRDRIATD